MREKFQGYNKKFPNWQKVKTDAFCDDSDFSFSANFIRLGKYLQCSLAYRG